MNRQPRRLSETGCYHVIFLGFNQPHLFEEERKAEFGMGHRFTGCE
jgi:hypothetical protein